MTWFKVDDTLAFHHKTIKAGNAAMGLWVRAGAWSAQHLTDGFVPNHMINVLGSASQRRRLVASGLWIEEEEGCFFHDWTENGRQPTREEVLLKRKQETERKAAFRAGSQVRGGRPPGTPSSVPDLSQGVSEHPDPTRPDPSLTTPPTPDGGLFSEPAASKTKSDKKIAADAAIEVEFEEFWTHWPRKITKKAALASYRTARKTVDAATILNAATMQAASWVTAGRDLDKIPHASTWLNQERWNDEVEKPRFKVINNPDSPWHGEKVSESASPWGDWMAK